MIRWVITSAVMMAVIAGCASLDNQAYIRDGVQYGKTSGTFRGRWWSYYERGASFLAGKYYDEAVADFETALQNRRSDSWRARTYGLHFTHYFPNRELGIAYYHQGRYTEAADMLESALEMVDTARGHHYLGLVKKALIAEGLLNDVDDPLLAFNVEESLLTADYVMPITIRATDDVGIAGVRLNNRSLPQRAPECDVDFKEEIRFAEGVHELEIVVTDLADKEKIEKRTITVDLTGPTIGLFSPTDAMIVEDALVTIEGVCVDDYGVASISVNDHVAVQGAGEKRMPFQTQAALQPGENTLRITARDQAGNETTSVVRIYQGDKNAAFSHAWLLRERCPERLMLAQAEGAASLPEVPAAEDRIVLRSPRPDQPNRHNRTVRVAGEVSASAGVSSLVINNQPFEQLTGAPKEIFSRRIPIEDPALLESGGKMTVAVAADGKDGKHLEEIREVELRPITLNTPQSRMPVAVVASGKEGVDPAITQSLCTDLIQGLVQKERFSIIERTELQLLLTEQQLSAELANPATKLLEGQMVAAKAYFVGEAYPQGDAAGCEIKIGAVDTETGLIVAIADAFIEDRESREARSAAALSLADQLANIFPRLSGELVLVRERGGRSELYFDWTREDGIRPGMYALVIYEEPEEYDEATGFITEGFTEIVGRVRLEDITDSGSRARPAAEDVKFEQGMAAITM